MNSIPPFPPSPSGDYDPLISLLGEYSSCNEPIDFETFNDSETDLTYFDDPVENAFTTLLPHKRSGEEIDTHPTKRQKRDPHTLTAPPVHPTSPLPPAYNILPVHPTSPPPPAYTLLPAHPTCPPHAYTQSDSKVGIWQSRRPEFEPGDSRCRSSPCVDTGAIAKQASKSEMPAQPKPTFESRGVYLSPFLPLSAPSAYSSYNPPLSMPLPIYAPPVVPSLAHFVLSVDNLLPEVSPGLTGRFLVIACMRKLQENDIDHVTFVQRLTFSNQTLYKMRSGQQLIFNSAALELSHALAHFGIDVDHKRLIDLGDHRARQLLNVLLHELHQKKHTNWEFATHAKLSVEEFQEYLSGRRPITKEVAIRLSEACNAYGYEIEPKLFETYP